jgi:hypothetical protein
LVAALVTVDAVWKLFGTEELVLTNESLTITTSVCGVKRTRSFEVSRIERVRVQERRTRRLIRRTIAFKYDGESVSSTSQLSDAEGRELLDGPLRDLARR